MSFTEESNMKPLSGLLILPAILLAQTLTSPAQFRKVDPELTHDRVIAIVPIVGAGTARDPKRPMFSDLPGLVGFTAELSDDGRHALVEFAVKERSRLDAILVSGQRLARKDSAEKAALLEEFKQYKRTFRPERFGVAIP
jgi:hypothetical protein